MAEKEYIERGAVISCILDVNNNLAGVVQHINEHVPAVDVVEVRHGEWERVRNLLVAVNPYQHTCGLCGKSYFDHNKFNYPYCPNCGAKMDGERKEQK